MPARVDPVEVFVDFLKKEGLNVTRSRLAVLRALSGLPRHFEAIDLWAALHPRVSPATIYRTLGLLERAGLVRKVELGEAHVHYERAFGREDHGHLVCRVCGRVWEFPVGEARNAVEAAAANKGFNLMEIVVQGYGVCPSCQASQETRV
ncbi:MAG: transcriptional repressor [Candidatus Bipolaricaulota bacterium]|nr:transcriptional repressor [Candidatus Bipolaricaulota bacterium]MDW8126480.1 Fur family transcriptional regulator [Candidatus Bipolaricaulota bacterium]